MGVASLAYGALYLAVGLLLLLSGAVPSLPGIDFVAWMTGWLVIVPPLLSVTAYLWGIPGGPPAWSLSTRMALVLRLLGAASIGLGFAALYALWFYLILMASPGFWGLLSPGARFLLLIPAFIVSVLFGYSQAIGHGRALISDAQVEWPTFQWAELVMTVAGYGILLAPLAALRFLPDLIAPPPGNIVVGLMLLAVGYALRREEASS